MFFSDTPTAKAHLLLPIFLRKSREKKQLSHYIRELEKHGYHVKAQS